jgi:thiosulfate/3-mercaptopyruvate sulfurtransferase
MIPLVLLLAAAAASTGYAHPELLVETAELAARAEQVRIIDVRPEPQYQQGHIPGAVHFDVRKLRTQDFDSGYLPTPAEFARLAGEIGIDNHTPVVIYDEGPSARAARLWYVLDHHGHRRAALLQGGWNRWKKEGRPAVTEATPVPRTVFKPEVRKASLSTGPELERKVGQREVVILDVRSADEYRGRTGRARTRGHIPGAVHVEWKENLTEAGAFKTAVELRRLYARAGVTPDKEVVTYCQTGGRASQSLFVLRLIGYDRTANYYGSWEDWGNRDINGAASTPPPATGK